MSDLKDALQRAREYRAKKAEEQKAEGKESAIEKAAGPIQEWRDVVSQRIEEAMREGQFDNLRNKGKPLKLERNPFVPQDMEMAYHILENNDLPPGWITERTALLKDIDRFREKLRAKMSADRQNNQSAKSSSSETDPNLPEWAKISELWREEIRALNKRIDNLNLIQPFAHLEIYKLVVEDEVQRAFASHVT
ncbi:MAG: DUF1992 domain-containing protein [Caldilineaceae bacterium]